MSKIGYPLFTQMISNPKEDLTLGETIFKDCFQIGNQIQQKYILWLTPTHLIISNNKNQQSIISITIINFQLKFEIIYSKQKNNCNQKIGFKLFKNINNVIQFYTKDYQKLKLWLLYFGSKINQRGFNNLFKPIKKLGKGNFAGVYEVQRIQDNKKFAVKAFSKMNSFTAKNGKQSLIIELQILRKLNHRNVLHLQGVFESDNSIYVVMELLQGGQLLRKITQNRNSFEPDDIRQFMLGLLKGLQHIHSLRIMHRDLKPQNILLRNSNSMEPVIVDFGLASFVDIQQYLFFRCGTPGYVAPQIIKLHKSQHIQPQCDIFSAGVIFHILLTGKQLFPGDNYDKIYLKNKHMSFDLNDPFYSSINPLAFDLLTKMLELNPQKRINALQALQHPYCTLQNWKQSISTEQQLQQQHSKLNLQQQLISGKLKSLVIK